jgi:glutathione peroxidase
MSVYECSYTSIEGKPVEMASYRGLVLLVVNTASKCGFTPQYEGLEKLHETYRDKGFTVIGFPSGQFNEQELPSNGEIREFCTARYGVSFPLSQKVEVRGSGAIPLYKHLTSQKGFEGMGGGLKAKMMQAMLKAKYGEGYQDDEVKWNFTKFLIDDGGEVVARYESPVDPKEIENDIKRLIRERTLREREKERKGNDTL